MPWAQREHLIARGIVPLQGLDEAMAAVDAAIRWCERAEGARGQDLGLPRDPGLPVSGTLLNEMQGKAALGELGLQVPQFLESLRMPTLLAKRRRQSVSPSYSRRSSRLLRTR